VLSGYEALVRQLKRVHDGAVVLTASAELDLAVFRPLAARLGLPLLGVTTPIQQAVDVVGNADAYIGGRWHPGIFALRGGAHVVALSSQTFKMKALAAMCGEAAVTFDALNLAPEAGAIAERLLRLAERGEGGRAESRRRAAELAETSWENVAFLRRRSTKHPGA
jgi:polysaccharide pyruvyl transferase WcaK-like protein